MKSRNCKIYFAIMFFVLVMLFITSCSSNLNVRIQGMVNDDCSCDLNFCRCEGEYSSDYIYLNCSDVEVNNILDVVKKCEYISIINGQEWKGQIIEVEKIVEKVCEVCEECEVCNGTNSTG